MDFSRFKPPHVTAERAEQMGYDAGHNMPNTTNCHFSLFATPELRDAWQRGKIRGDAEREGIPPQGSAR